MRSPRESPAASSAAAAAAAALDSFVLLLGGPLGPAVREPFPCTEPSLPLPPFLGCDDAGAVGCGCLAVGPPV